MHLFLTKGGIAWRLPMVEGSLSCSKQADEKTFIPLSGYRSKSVRSCEIVRQAAWAHLQGGLLKTGTKCLLSTMRRFFSSRRSGSRLFVEQVSAGGDSLFFLTFALFV